MGGTGLSKTSPDLSAAGGVRCVNTVRGRFPTEGTGTIRPIGVACVSQSENIPDWGLPPN